MAFLRRNTARQSGLLLFLSLAFLGVYIVRAASTRDGSPAGSLSRKNRPTASGGRRPGLPGEEQNSVLRKQRNATRTHLELQGSATGADRRQPATESAINTKFLAATGESYYVGDSPSKTEGYLTQSPAAVLGNGAPSDDKHSASFATSSSPPAPTEPFAAFHRPQSIEESEAHSHPAALTAPSSSASLPIPTDFFAASRQGLKLLEGTVTFAGPLASSENYSADLRSASPRETSPLYQSSSQAATLTGPTSVRMDHSSADQGTSTTAVDLPVSSKNNRAAYVMNAHAAAAVASPTSPQKPAADSRFQYQTDFFNMIRRNISWVRRLSGETPLKEKFASKAASAADVGSWPRLLQEEINYRVESRDRHESAQPCRRIECLQVKVAAQSSAFEEAAGRACSPSSHAKYVDIVQNQMGGALDNLEDLIGKVTSGWLNGTFGYENLIALLQDDITIWTYVKRHPVYLAMVCLAVTVVILWLFGCLPKVCCRCCRRLCFCIPERMHKISFLGRLIVTILGGIALLVMIIFAILAASAQYSGVGGVRALQCHLYSTVGEMIKGTNTTQVVDPNEQFVGVKPLFKELRKVATKLDVTQPESIVKDLRKQVTEDLNFSKGIAASNGYLDALKQSLVNNHNDIQSFFHVCQACEAAKPGMPVAAALDALKIALSSDSLNMTEAIDKLFEQFTFPSIVLDEVIPVDTIEKTLAKVTDKLAETEAPVSSGLTYTEAGFGVTYAFVFLMACLGVVWTVFFFFRGAKTGCAPACFQWNMLCFTLFLILLVAGILGFATNTALSGCEYVNKELVVQDKWDDILKKVDPDGGTITQLTRGCFGDAAAGNLVDILGYRTEFDRMIKKVNDALDMLLNNVPTVPVIDVTTPINSLRAVAREYAWAATTNFKVPPLAATSDPNSRLHTFIPFLVSGVQMEDKKILPSILDNTAAASNTVTLYGLRSLEKLVQPWQFSAIRGQDPDDKLLITDKYPQETDAFLLQWLAEYEKAELKKLTAASDADAAAKAKKAALHMKNAIWWSVQKHKVLYKNYNCPVFDPSTNTIVQQTCDGRTFFAYTPLDWSQGYIVGTAEKLADSASSLAEAVKHAPTKAGNNASDTILGLVKTVKELVKGLNCKFMRRSFLTGTNIACNSAFYPIYKAAVYSIVTCAGILLWTVLLLVVWRKLKDNATLKKAEK